MLWLSNAKEKRMVSCARLLYVQGCPDIQQQTMSHSSRKIAFPQMLGNWTITAHRKEVILCQASEQVQKLQNREKM